ncbi:carbamoyltransferase family protein [Kordia jejudonensis]|uniref:carbamoyltransferase family protein n=1 Tax=Kordia jejudonensis TaxID=1348245 RepID=UPI0006294488|nr:carbamoyltransferase [Kordia jejudonensis]
MKVNIIGISAFYHDASCCILQEGKLIAAAEEERFTRIKFDPSVPKHALNYCLEAAGITIKDVNCIAFYEDPTKKIARQIWSGLIKNDSTLKETNFNKVEDEIRNVLGFEGDIIYVDHHASHAASAYYFSGFDNAALLTVDGVGEWATTTYGIGKGDHIELFEEVHFPHSIGLLYSTITSYLGFLVNNGEYKVMGLAPYGKPLYVDQVRELIALQEEGQFELNMKYFDFVKGTKMYTDLLPELFGRAPRERESEMEQFHMDVAKSLQVVLEETLIAKANYLYEKTGAENLCMAGGVALNCVANGKILKNTKFKKLFVQPSSNDAGGALGAAALAYVQRTGKRPNNERLPHAYLGPSFSSTEIAQLLGATNINYQNLIGDEKNLMKEIATRLSEGKVIGWFQGRMEFGPRALGARSIIADPRNPEMKDRINAMVKKREGFRPFAPAALHEKAMEHFDIDHESPFMLETCQVISKLFLPAITHVDGSARLQTVTKEANGRFYELLKAFDEITECPILLNTSFNVRGEPIVCTPEDAIKCFVNTDIDCLVLGDFIIDRSQNNFDLLRLFLQNDVNQAKSGIEHDVYTFI